MTDREKLEAVKAEIERRMFHDYNSGDEEMDAVAQGVCAGILSYINPLLEDDRCKDCNNVKGCITCENGDQYCHITEC